MCINIYQIFNFPLNTYTIYYKTIWSIINIYIKKKVKKPAGTIIIIIIKNKNAILLKYSKLNSIFVFVTYFWNAVNAVLKLSKHFILSYRRHSEIIVNIFNTYLYYVFMN